MQHNTIQYKQNTPSNNRGYYKTIETRLLYYYETIANDFIPIVIRDVCLSVDGMEI